MPIELGDSWFSPKCIEVQRREFPSGGRALDGSGGASLPIPTKLRMPVRLDPGSETVGDKLHCQKGNSPDHRLRSLRLT